MVAAYESGQCDAFTNDRSQLAALGTSLSNRDAHVILPETISEEPLGPVVPHGDDQWFDIVKSVMGILIYGEAYGISSSNLPAAATGDTKRDRLLGFDGSWGQESLGLSNTAAQDVIRAVGNYGEIYDRNLGPDGINLPREGGRNALWADASLPGLPQGRPDLRGSPALKARQAGNSITGNPIKRRGGFQTRPYLSVCGARNRVEWRATVTINAEFQHDITPHPHLPGHPRLAARPGNPVDRADRVGLSGGVPGCLVLLQHRQRH